MISQYVISLGIFHLLNGAKEPHCMSKALFIGV